MSNPQKDFFYFSFLLVLLPPWWHPSSAAAPVPWRRLLAGASPSAPLVACFVASACPGAPGSALPRCCFPSSRGAQPLPWSISLPFCCFLYFFWGGADESKCILHGISLPSGAKWCWLSCPSGVPCLGTFSTVCPAAKMQSQQAVCASSVAGEQDMGLLLASEPLPGGEGCAEQCVCSL